MCGFRSEASLQKFAVIQGQVQNYFNARHHLVNRTKYQECRSMALAKWRVLAA